MQLRQAQGTIAAYGLKVGEHHVVANLLQGGFTGNHLCHEGVGASRLDQVLVEQVVGKFALRLV